MYTEQYNPTFKAFSYSNKPYISCYRLLDIVLIPVEEQREA
ncbi:hypothetical protein [Bacillus thuringiensis]|nr:hypothetical protein [Bacillus thuringiensis]